MKLMLLVVSLVAANGACLPVRSGRITVGDVAEIVPAFAQLAPEAEMSFAPTPGMTRLFSPAELNARLVRNGIGASVTEPVCFEWPMRVTTEEEIREAMLAALPAGSQVEISGPMQVPIPPGPLQFTIDGLRGGVWSGYVSYDTNRKFTLTLRVKIQAPWNRLIATESIRSGERITANNVRIESGSGEPSRGQYIESLDDALHRVARRALRAGSPIEKIALGDRRVVARGDTVHVDVISGGATLRFDGIAESAASAGALVPVRNPTTGKIVHARIDEKGHARLDLSGREN